MRWWPWLANGAVATSSRATVRRPLRSQETGLSGGEGWAPTPWHEVVLRAALRTWAAATSRAAARPAPRRSHGTSRGGGDDLGSGPAARGSAAPAAMRAACGRPLRPSIGTPGPVVFRSVAWRVGWSLGEFLGVRKRSELKLLVSYRPLGRRAARLRRARTPPFLLLIANRCTQRSH